MSYCPKCKSYIIPNSEKCPSCKFEVRKFVQSNYYIPMKKKADLERTLDQELNFLWKIILFFFPFTLILLYILPFPKNQRHEGFIFVLKIGLFFFFAFVFLFILALVFSFYLPPYLTIP